MTKPSFISCSFGRTCVFHQLGRHFFAWRFAGRREGYSDTVFSQPPRSSVELMYLWALTTFSHRPESAKIQSRSPCLSESTLRCRHCFSLFRTRFGQSSSRRRYLPKQMSPRANSSMMEGLKRFTSGRMVFKLPPPLSNLQDSSL